MTTPDLARQHADLLSGATYDDLRARADAAHRALEAWTAHYAAGLALAATVSAEKAPPLSPKQIAHQLNCGRSTVSELIRSGRLRKLDGFGRSVRVAQSDVDAFVDTRKDTT